MMNELWKQLLLTYLFNLRLIFLIGDYIHFAHTFLIYKSLSIADLLHIGFNLAFIQKAPDICQ